MSKKYTTNFLEDTNGSTGSANQVLVSTAAGIDWVDGSGSGIIGGPYLPLAGGTMTASGTTRFPDSTYLQFGTSGDANIYHDATNTYFKNFTGNLIIQNNSDDKDIILQSDDGLGGVATYFELDGAAGYNKAHKDILYLDNIKARFGNSNDLQIYHDGSDSYINDTGTGHLVLNTNGASMKFLFGSEFMAQFEANGSVDLYHNNSKKFETTSSGVTVTGTATATTFLGDLNGTINTVTTAVTKANATNDTTVATTAFVQNLIGTIPAGLVFQGTWNAATNTPTLTSGTGTTGHFYIVSTSGSTNLDGITDWVTGDWAVFIEQGATDAWEKIDNSSVLDGAGTGQTLPLWSGSGTSNTLTDSIITQTGVSPNQIIRITSNADAQLRLDGAATSYAGIHWVDNNGGDYMWFSGSTSTFAIGGGGSSVSGKKLHIDGSTSIGSNYDSVSPPTNGLVVEGNVGIGTTGPAYKLDVNSSAFVGARIESTAAGYAPASILLESGDSDSRGQGIYQYNSVSKNSWFSGVPYSTTSDDWIIAHKLETTAFNSDVAQMGNALFCVNDTGKVGIGTTSPTANLYVKGTAGGVNWLTVGDSAYTLLNVDNYGRTSINRQLSVGSSSGYSNVADVKLAITGLSGQTGNYLDINSNGTTGGGIFTVRAGGNVGIGTTSPLAKLQVNSITASTMSQVAGEAHIVGVNHDLSDTQMGTLNLTSTSRDAGTNNQALGPSLTFSQNASKYVDGYEVVIGGIKTELMYTGNMNKSSIMNFYTHTNSGLTPKMSIDADGNVGIGTTSPSQKLEVDGNVKAETLIATDLTDGYVPYSKSGTLGLQDSKIYTNGAGIGVGTTTLAAGCHITSLSDISATGYRVSAMQTAPSSRGDTGTLGEIRITADYIYVCYATDSWKRVAIAQW